MSGIDLFWLLLKISGLLTGVGLIRWQRGRHPYRSGYPIRMTPPSQPEDAPTATRTVHPVTHTTFIGVPRDTGLDYGRLNEALNWQDTPDNYKPQGDDHTGGPFGIL
jgi:hypothetical protein